MFSLRDAAAPMDVTVREVEPGEAAAIGEPILRALPAWFGIEAALAQYVADLARRRTWVAYVDERPVGFAALAFHNAATAEIHVMGVLPTTHRRGVGRALVERLAAEARAAGRSLLEVKTLGPSRPNADYAATRAFYAALGFLPLEEIAEVWGPANPCLILVRWLGA